ncbi:hypothetical protein C8Q70DRAFT_994149 [Cubamyces menziesii]|nr:hypothetical protein C8Q70DRAFT_994149 [Cubamyces menziesii]
MHFTDPWHITVIRTRGLTYVRPEKSWRPVVKVTVVDGGHDYALPDVALGSDGQNPNLKSVIPIHGANPAMSLVVQVLHRSQTKKKHRKPTLVGSAKLSLGEVLSRHPLPHPRPVEYDVRLSCPPPQRKSPTIGGRQQHCATLTLKFIVPHPTQTPCDSPPLSPAETEAIFSDGASSSKGLLDGMLASTSDHPVEEMPEEQLPGSSGLPGTTGLRRRRRRPRGFHVDSDSDAYISESSDDGPWPPTPPNEEFPTIYEDVEDGPCGLPTFDGQSDVAVISPCVIPMHSGGNGGASSRESLPLPGSVVNVFAPYQELCEADQDNDIDKAEKVLNRLLTEWYVVGASLLALAGIDSAVFGFAPGSMYVIDGFSQSVVAIGAIAAGIGLVTDAWFLVLYSGASAEKFQRVAKDVYNTYFFFCLTCRLPTMCMFVSAIALMFFLLGVAYTAWPTAVLVMSFCAGLLFSSQFLIFGAHRSVEFVIWGIRVLWRKSLYALGRAPAPQPQPQQQLHIHIHPHTQSQSHTQSHTVHVHFPQQLPPRPHSTPPAHTSYIPRADRPEELLEMPIPKPAAI